MRLKWILCIFLFFLLVFPGAGLAGDKWISISPMAFSTHDDVQKALIYKTDFGNEAYVTLGTNYGHIWAPVNFPFQTGRRVLTKLEARFFDNLDITNPTQTMDWAWIGVSLVKLDFSTGQTETVMSVGTAWQGAPGHVIRSDTTGGDLYIDNKRYSWFLRCTVELSSTSLHDDLRLYGVRISYR